MRSLKKPELLAPAGNLEKVRWAFMYGADAVYFGGRNYSLRANAQNLSIDEMKEACDLAHQLNKKVYVTINIIFHNEDIKGLKEYIKSLNEIGVDAIIISDPFVIKIRNEVAPKLNMFLSTQQNTLNYEECKFWKSQGIKRIVLARETSKLDIQNIIKNVDVELEVFIQGAMCVGYSGRCVLSNYFTNRDSNRGGCSQICRWNFDLLDSNKNKIQGENDFAATVKDLTMVPHIKELMDMKIASFKIEGRMRSIYYIATVLNVYRKIIDEYYDTGKISNIDSYHKEIVRCANRDSVVQYFLKKPGVNEQYYAAREETSNKDFLGIVLGYDERNKEMIVEQRNYFSVGDAVTIFGPNMDNIDLNIKYIKDEKGNALDVARHPQQIIRVYSEKEIKENSILRVSFNK